MQVVGVRACLLACPLGAGGQGAWLPVSCGVCSVPLSLPFVPLRLLLSSNTCGICLYSRFKGVFSAVWGVRVGLFVLGALRGLRGFCVREWLGGFGACCVFAPVFLRVCLYLSLYLPFFLSLYLLLVLLSFVGLVAFRFPCLSSGFPCGLLSFLFPFRTKRKKSAFVLRSFFTWF